MEALDPHGEKHEDGYKMLGFYQINDLFIEKTFPEQNIEDETWNGSYKMS